VVPRGGGVAFIISWFVGCSGLVALTKLCVFGLDLAVLDLPLLMPALLIIAVLGLTDDIKGISYKIRFGVQILLGACTASYFLQFVSNEAFTSVPVLSSLGVGVGTLKFGLGCFIALCCAWAINLFNFMDGIDGLSSVGAIYLFLFGSIVFYHSNITMVMFSWLIIAAILGFLVFNWPQAKVFMGDAGSYFLGLFIALYVLVAIVKLHTSPFIWLIIYGVFWFDTTVTLLRRLAYGKNIATAHREHAYQRLQNVGWKHKHILWGLIIVNAVLLVLALAAHSLPALRVPLFGVALLLLASLYWRVERMAPMAF
jgi:Fuc2NAc and GlcNAc transferase